MGVEWSGVWYSDNIAILKHILFDIMVKVEAGVILLDVIESRCNLVGPGRGSLSSSVTSWSREIMWLWLCCWYTEVDFNLDVTIVVEEVYANLFDQTIVKVEVDVDMDVSLLNVGAVIEEMNVV